MGHVWGSVSGTEEVRAQSCRWMCGDGVTLKKMAHLANSVRFAAPFSLSGSTTA